MYDLSSNVILVQESLHGKCWRNKEKNGIQSDERRKKGLNERRMKKKTLLFRSLFYYFFFLFLSFSFPPYFSPGCVGKTDRERRHTQLTSFVLLYATRKTVKGEGEEKGIKRKSKGKRRIHTSSNAFPSRSEGVSLSFTNVSYSVQLQHV